MAAWNPRGQSYSLPTAANLTNRNALPVSTSNIGNIYPVGQSQSLSVSVEAQVPRRVLLSNVGSIPLIVSDTQRDFPFGLRLCSGDILELVTSSALWVAAPPTVRFVSTIPGIVASIGYVSVSVAA